MATREAHDLSIFRRFMSRIMTEQLRRDIDSFEQSIVTEPIIEYAPAKPQKTRNRITALLKRNPAMSATALAAAIGISPQGIRRHLASMKSEGVLLREGPDKGGRWLVKE